MVLARVPSLVVVETKQEYERLQIVTLILIGQGEYILDVSHLIIFWKQGHLWISMLIEMIYKEKFGDFHNGPCVGLLFLGMFIYDTVGTIILSHLLSCLFLHNHIHAKLSLHLFLTTRLLSFSIYNFNFFITI
ncbi:hypothetical protein ACJX0J_026898 [Zea mays]